MVGWANLCLDPGGQFGRHDEPPKGEYRLSLAGRRLSEATGGLGFSGGRDLPPASKEQLQSIHRKETKSEQ